MKKPFFGIKKFLIAVCPVFFAGHLVAQKADTSQLFQHLGHIISDSAHRNARNIQELDRVAEYIRSEFSKYSDTVWVQTYTADGRVYRNVICSFGPLQSPRTVVGAHYDVCGNQDGADDNASGVAGLLELCRMLKGAPLEQRIDLVAYTLEEPPYFGTVHMGSYVHAQYLYTKGVKVKGMISLEMIGYFSGEKHSQRYPVGLLKVFYGSRGNYIAVVRKTGAGKFARKFTRTMKKNDHTVRTRSISAPRSMTGIDFSDHRNYWAFGYGAVMVTDTSFYRNAHYHKNGDTIGILDLEKMAGVVTQVYETLVK